MADTPNLHLPLIQDYTIVNKSNINNVSVNADTYALPIEHKDSKSHWDLWKKETNYQKGDLIRVETNKSWGFLECTTAGKSGTTMPVSPLNLGYTVVDGGVTWTLRKIASEAGGDWCTKKQAIAYAIALG